MKIAVYVTPCLVLVRGQRKHIWKENQVMDVYQNQDDFV